MDEITACTLDCPDTCSLLVKRNTSGDISIGGNPKHPFTAGFICKKGRNFLHRLRSPHRITTPLLRTADGWAPISWTQAVAACVAKIDEYRKEPSSILHIHGEGSKGVLKQAGKLFFSLLGASRTKGSLCDAAGYVAGVADFGSRDNNDITDLVNARIIVNWGKDLSRSSIHTASLVRKARLQGAKVITISPGGDGNHSFSDVSIRVRPGTDRFLAAAVIRRLIDDDRVASDVLPHTANWDGFRRLISASDPDALRRQSDVNPTDITVLAEAYGSRLPVATLIGAGLQRYFHGGQNVRFINALALLSGNIGRSGGGSYFHLHSLRNVNLDWTKDPQRKSRRSLLLPIIGTEILQAQQPPIRMIWVEGSNIVNQAPDSNQLVRAFKTVDFKVVVDAFMTDTAEQADLVLPCTLMLEQEDIVASYMHNYVHYAKAVIEPPKEAKTDYWILSTIGRSLSPPVILPEPNEIFRAALKGPHLDIALERLREERFVRAERYQVAYAGAKFDHPDGLYRFPLSLDPEPIAPPGFPLKLLTAIRGGSTHSQILPEQQAIPPVVRVSPGNPVLAKIKDKDRVLLASPLGKFPVRLEVQEGLHPEVVLYRRGDWMKLGGGANRVIEAHLTDIGNGAPYYQQCVTLENG